MFYSYPLLRQYAIVIVVNLSVICAGLSISWPSPVVVKLNDPELTVLPEPITTEEASWVVSIGFIFATFVNFFQSYLLDKLGRKNCVVLALFPMLAACILFIFANRVWMLLLGRIVMAVAVGMLYAVVPTYASEIASKEIRGALGTILQICSSLGIVLMLSIGPFISYIALNVALACAVIIATIPILFLPDSPYSLYSKGVLLTVTTICPQFGELAISKTEEAEKVLISIRGSESMAQEEIMEYALSSTDDKIDKGQLFRNRIFLKAAAIVMVLGVGGQIVGFNAISFYLQTILESTQTSVKSEFASVIIGCLQLVASICTAFMTDRFGRKPILCITFIVMALGMVGMGTFFQIRENTQQVTGLLNFLPLVSLILVVVCYSAGFGSISWLVIAELFEGPARAVGVTFFVIPSFFSSFLMLRYFSLLTFAIGPAVTYWLFGANCLLISFFIYFCIPETKGKSFAEVQVALGARMNGNIADVEREGQFK